MSFLRRLSAAITGSLKLKLTFCIVALLGLTIGIAPWIALRIQERQLLDASADRLLALHQMLERTIVDTCMATASDDAVQKMLEAVSTHRNFEAVRLFDTHGLIRHSSRPQERGQRLDFEDFARFVGQPEPVVLHPPGGPVIQTLVRPMFNGPECVNCHNAKDKVLGVLQVSVSIEPMWERLTRLKRWALGATALTLVVLIIGVWTFLTLFVDRPLQHLVAVMGSADQGNLGVRAEVRHRDELGRLADHFNAMLARLQTAQTELAQYHQDQLAHADRLATIGQMAAAIAHEIRNPLTGISGALSVLGRGFPEDDQRRDVIRQSQLLIERLNKTVEDILVYSRPSPPKLQRVRLDEVVARACSLVASEANKARIQIQQETLDAATLWVDADPQHLQQLVVNLVFNAIHASPAGSEVHVRAYAATDDGGAECVRIEVEDRGKGMKPEDLEKAFTPFFSTKAQGTGLGLPIAKQIVKRHGGTITLRSTLGVGTCVQVDLPPQPPPAGLGDLRPCRPHASSSSTTSR